MFIKLEPHRSPLSKNGEILRSWGKIGRMKLQQQKRRQLALTHARIPLQRVKALARARSASSKPLGQGIAHTPCGFVPTQAKVQVLNWPSL
jgi:hypothetical protein